MLVLGAWSEAVPWQGIIFCLLSGNPGMLVNPGAPSDHMPALPAWSIWTGQQCHHGRMGLRRTRGSMSFGSGTQSLMLPNGALPGLCNCVVHRWITLVCGTSVCPVSTSTDSLTHTGALSNRVTRMSRQGRPASAVATQSLHDGYRNRGPHGPPLLMS